MKKTLPMSYSRSIQTRLVLPPDTNHHESIFGGKVLAYIDEIAAIAAMKHSQGEVVTASFDSVGFFWFSRIFFPNSFVIISLISWYARS